MKILFVTFNGVEDAAFGGAKGSRRNYELLQRQGETEVYTIRKKSDARSLLSVLQGHYPPADNEDLRRIRKRLSEESFDLVFFDGSHFGKLVEAVKAEGLPVIVYFHNCEYDYIEVRFGQADTLKKRIYKRVIRGQEGLSARISDINVTLTERDARRVRELYGAETDYVIPLSLPDVFRRDERDGRTQDGSGGDGCGNRAEERICLLFGPLGRANEEGFAWFVTNVSPKLPCITVVAGKGFERYRDQWTGGKVRVVGTVDDIARLYAEASCVAIPLFSGSGMKIKTAEALMFGKRIFGTDEAFEGYDTAAEGAGAVCNTAEEFIREISAFLAGEPDCFQPAARRLYEEQYSLQASEKKFEELLESVK